MRRQDVRREEQIRSLQDWQARQNGSLQRMEATMAAMPPQFEKKLEDGLGKVESKVDRAIEALEVKVDKAIDTLHARLAALQLWLIGLMGSAVLACVLLALNIVLGFIGKKGP